MVEAVRGTARSRLLLPATPISDVYAAGAVCGTAHTRRKKPHGKQPGLARLSRKTQDDAEAGMSMVAYDAAADAASSVHETAAVVPDSTASNGGFNVISLNGIANKGSAVARYKGQATAHDPTLEFEID